MQENRLHWVKASSSATLNACVELADDGEGIALRNSRDTSAVLQFTRMELAAFLDGAKKGEFDHLIERRN
jgi:hypothetical protein